MAATAAAAGRGGRSVAGGRRLLPGLGRAALVGLAAVGLAHLHLRWRPATLCPLRALTGIPCPLCGATTAAVHLGSGDLLGALRTAPVPVLAGLALVTAPLGTAARWWAASARTRAVMIAGALLAAEVWQLVRFGIL